MEPTVNQIMALLIHPLVLRAGGSDYVTRTLPITADRSVVTWYHQKRKGRVVGLGQVAFAHCT